MARHEHCDPRRLPGRRAQAALRRQAGRVRGQGLHQHGQGHRATIGPPQGCRRDRADPRAHPHLPPTDREAAQAQAHLADRPRRRAHRRHGLHRARRRGGGRLGLSAGACRAHLGADHGRDAPAAPVHQQPQARRLATVGPQVGLDAAQLRPGLGAQGQDAVHLGLRPHRPAGRALRAGLRHAGRDLGPRSQLRQGAGSDGFQVAQNRRRVLRRGRRAVGAPAAQRRNQRPHHARRPVAHEADGAVRQHLARRAGRSRTPCSPRSTAAAPGWPPSTCSRANRRCKATRCCGSRTASARRTSATSSRTATRCTSARPSTTLESSPARISSRRTGSRRDPRCWCWCGNACSDPESPCRAWPAAGPAVPG